MQTSSATSSGLNPGNQPVLKKEKSRTRKVLDGTNLAIAGVAAATKLSNVFIPNNDFLHTGSEIVTRGGLIGTASLGLVDAVKEKKNLVVAIGQTLEIAIVTFVDRADKWLFRGISQCLLNIGSPIRKAHEIFKKVTSPDEPLADSFYSDYGSLEYKDAIGKSIKLSFYSFFKAWGELFKKPALFKEHLTYPLTVFSSCIGVGGLLGFTPFRQTASLTRFSGAVPIDVVYALMGHQSNEDYNPNEPLTMKKFFDFKSYLGWAGKLWLVPGIADPLQRLPMFEEYSTQLNDFGDAFNAAASAFYQASLLQSSNETISEPVTPATPTPDPHSGQQVPVTQPA